MEVKDGFRNTELGRLPYDWRVDQLCSLNPFVTSGSRGWARYYADRGAPFIRITNLSRSSIYLDLSDMKLVSLPAEDREGLRTQLQAGDLLVSITADIGIIGYVDGRVPQPAYINQHIALVRCDPTAVDTKFLAYFLASEHPQRAFHAGTDQGAKAGMNLAGVLKIQAAFPAMPEQRAISTVLGDVDALLSELDQLIAKKRDLKQAAMQQLLTGRARLPGFSGEWEVKSLAELTSLTKGVQLHSSETNDQGRYPHFNGGISPSGYTDKTNTAANTIAISEGGNSCGYVQLIPQEFWCGGHCYAIAPKSIDNQLLYHALKGRQTAIMGLRVGSGLPNVQKTALAAFILSVPSAPLEQAAIAAVLSDMDAEMAALEARRNKTRDLKQAMMQELLTGKTRLVPAGAAHA